mmetsp:Transcript_3548/g.14736  ORF Transcript_3548/g.14736 Transcript_3548/m.14736 type:complete len:227 (+) Transcript_3548:1316-1996(+)
MNLCFSRSSVQIVPPSERVMTMSSRMASNCRRVLRRAPAISSPSSRSSHVQPSSSSMRLPERRTMATSSTTSTWRPRRPAHSGWPTSAEPNLRVGAPDFSARWVWRARRRASRCCLPLLWPALPDAAAAAPGRAAAAAAASAASRDSVSGSGSREGSLASRWMRASAAGATKPGGTPLRKRRRGAEASGSSPASAALMAATAIAVCFAALRPCARRALASRSATPV